MTAQSSPSANAAGPSQGADISASEGRSGRVPICWVVTDGRAGIESQALGLAEAVGRLTPLQIVVKRVRLAPPLSWAPTASAPAFLARPTPMSDQLDGPPPDLWIACGRQAALFSIAARQRRIKQHKPATGAAGQSGAPFIVQLQNPKAPLRRFDLVVPPIHDGLVGENVFPILGAPNRIAGPVLRDAAERLRASIFATSGREGDKRPIYGFIIGGPNKTYQFTDGVLARLTEAMTRLVGDGAHLVITFSRRTPRDFAEALRSAAPSGCFVFDPNDPRGADNPYPGLLGLSDAVFVTEDSVNMISEATTAGAKTHILSLSPRSQKPGKFAAFLQSMEERDLVRRFDGRVQHWTVPPFDETARAAEEVRRRWLAHCASRSAWKN